MSRILLAFKSFFSLLFSGVLPEDVMASLNLTRRVNIPQTPKAAAAPKPAPVNTPADGAVQILALLQRDGRLLDFLMEDIAPYTDDQVGAAIRDVHRSCREVLSRHLSLSPIVDGVEGAVTTLSTVGIAPTDTNRLKIVGKVPPDGKVDSGVLRHRGWRAEKIDLPPLKPGEKQTILAPAEIEVE